jgi:HAD superfamily hydrolase (TIGR01509 family)
VTRELARGVIFDLDGTLYTLPWMKARMALALWRSVSLLRALTSSRGALRGRAFPDREALLAALHRELADRAGTTADRAAAWYDGRFLPAFVALLARGATVRPGLAALLARLRGRGVRTAVVSDFGRVADRVAAIGLAPALFDDLVAAEDHGVLKPSAAPFAAVARGWGIGASEIVVVGDREDLDAASARAAGMGYVGVGNWTEASSAIEARTEFGVTR